MVSDPKEWRNRLVNTKSYQQKVIDIAPDTYATLERVAEDLGRTLTALRQAESKLNTQCHAEIATFAEKQEELKAKQEEYGKNSEYDNQLTNDLAVVSEELASIKGRMDERGNSMTDTAPLIKIKSALSQIRNETKQMEIRIGVVTHTLVAKKLQSDQTTKAEASQPKNGHVAQETYLEDDFDEYG